MVLDSSMIKGHSQEFKMQRVTDFQKGWCMYAGGRGGIILKQSSGVNKSRKLGFQIRQRPCMILEDGTRIQ